MVDKKLIYYDLETTGTRHWLNGIHQIAGLVEINGKVVQEFNIKMRPNPKAKIEAEALEHSHLTEATILGYKKSMEQGYKEFLSILDAHIDRFDKKDKATLCGFNNRQFDDQFLRSLFLQNSNEYFGSYFWSNSLDVMVLATEALLDERHLMKDFKLGTVATHVGLAVDPEKQHDGVYDVNLTRRLHQTLKFL